MKYTITSLSIQEDTIKSDQEKNEEWIIPIRNDGWNKNLSDRLKCMLENLREL